MFDMKGEKNLHALPKKIFGENKNVDTIIYFDVMYQNVCRTRAHAHAPYKKKPSLYSRKKQQQQHNIKLFFIAIILLF